jgi:hypothetical protein
MNLETLKARLTDVLPISDANLSAAHMEYLSGKIPRGAFEYVRSRHEDALAVIACDNIPVELAFKACALLAIDLRDGVKEVPDVAQAQAMVDAWWQCYRDFGYTELNTFFDSPAQVIIVG